MVRQSGLGMNQPKKTKVAVVEELNVKVLLRGVACELEPELEAEPGKPPCANPAVDRAELKLRTVVEKVRFYKDKRTHFKSIAKRATERQKHCRARANALGKRAQPGLSPNALHEWRVERKALAEEARACAEVRTDAETAEQEALLLQVIQQRCAAEMKVVLLNACFHVCEVPAYVQDVRARISGQV